MKSAVSRPVQSTGPRAASTVNLLPPLSVTTVGCSVCSVTTFMPLWTSNHSDCVTAAALPPHTAYLLVCWFLQWKDWLTSCWTLLTRDIISSGPGVGQTQIFDDAAAATTTTWHHCVVFSVVFVYYNYNYNLLRNMYVSLWCSQLSRRSRTLCLQAPSAQVRRPWVKVGQR